MSRESSATFTQRLSLIVAVGIKQTETRASEVKGVVQLRSGRVVVIVTLSVHNASFRREATCSRLIVTLQAIGRITQFIVQVLAKRIINQTHPGIEIVAVTRRFAEVLSEEHGVVTWFFRIKK